MKNNPLVLTLDFGTQSVRTALINKAGEIEAIVKRKYNQIIEAINNEEDIFSYLFSLCFLPTLCITCWTVIFIMLMNLIYY